MAEHRVLYVMGPESGGKTDLLEQLQCASGGQARVLPRKTAATAGQEIRTLPVGAAAVEVRELGGAVAASWPSFAAARAGQDRTTRYALMYVVDATAPPRLPLAAGMLRALEGPCGAWPALVVLHKCAAPHAMVPAEIAEFLFAPSGLPPPGTRVVEADSWNGLGIGDVWEWLQSFVAGRL